MNDNWHLIWLKDQLPEWISNNLISEKQASDIECFYKNKQAEEMLEYQKRIAASEKQSGRQLQIFLSVVAGLLVSGGVISLCAFNWHSISREVKCYASWIISFIVPLIFLLKKCSGKQDFSQFVKEFLSVMWLGLFSAGFAYISIAYKLPVDAHVELFVIVVMSLFVAWASRSYSAFYSALALILSLTITLKVVESPLIIAALPFLFVLLPLAEGKIKKILLLCTVSVVSLITAFGANGLAVTMVAFFIFAVVNFYLFRKSGIIYEAFNHAVLIFLCFLNVILISVSSDFICVEQLDFNAILALVVSGLYFVAGVVLLWLLVSSCRNFLNIENLIIIGIFVYSAVLFVFKIYEINLDKVLSLVQLAILFGLSLYVAFRIIKNNELFYVFLIACYALCNLIYCGAQEIDLISGSVVMNYLIPVVLSLVVMSSVSCGSTIKKFGSALSFLLLFILNFENVHGCHLLTDDFFLEKALLCFVPFVCLCLLCFFLLKSDEVTVLDKVCFSLVSLLNFAELVLCQFLEINLTMALVFSYVIFVMLMIFCILKIIDSFKAVDVKVCNFYLVSMLCIIFIRFFSLTDSLITRGVIFILLGVVLYCVNLVLAKRGKNEK